MYIPSLKGSSIIPLSEVVNTLYGTPFIISSVPSGFPNSSTGSISTSSLSIIASSFIASFVPGKRSVVILSIDVMLNTFFASNPILTVLFSIV